MKALISPLEKVYSNDETVLGYRIAQVCEKEFPIAPPLFWANCSNDCVADQWYYSVKDNKLYIKPVLELTPEANTP